MILFAVFPHQTIMAYAESSGQGWKNYLVHPLVTAGVFAGATYALYNGYVVPSFLGMKDVPVWAISAGAGAGATLAAEIVRDKVLPHLSSDKKLQTMETAVVEVGGAGLVFGAIASVVIPGSAEVVGLPKLIAIGAGSSVLSNYLYNSFLV